MPGFDLSNYKTVPERIAEAKARYPEGRFQTELLYIPDHPDYIAVKAKFFRTEDDPTPGEGVAWEIVPGRTPYTKDSELQNAETSAWGRALVAAFAVDASKGIASREEVQNRQPEPRPRSGGRKVTPSPDSPVTAPPSDGNGKDGEAVTKLKRSLLARTAGDKAEAKRLWDGTLEMFGYSPTDEIPDDMVAALGSAVEALAIKGEE